MNFAGFQCAICGGSEDLDFHVPDEAWALVPESYQTGILCMACFMPMVECDVIEGWYAEC